MIESSIVIWGNTPSAAAAEGHAPHRGSWDTTTSRRGQGATTQARPGPYAGAAVAHSARPGTGAKPMIWPAVLSVMSFAAAATPPAPAVEVPASVSPIPAHRVEITDTFWSARQRANREGTLAANFEQCEKTGRIENFVKAAKGPGTAKYEGYFFNDSDVYKAIEGACLVLERTKD